MERYCSTGQSPQRAVAPTEKEEGDFTFLIYCVLLIEDTLSTEESNNKSFHNISTSVCTQTSYYLKTSTSTSGY